MIDFTPTQQQAIEQFDQNICVSAGAGSGKTSVLVERFLQLVVHKQVSPRRILAMTYTEKAANELKKRLVSEFEARGLIEPRQELESAYIGTIHSLCVRFLRENPVEAGVHPDFAVLNEDASELEANRLLDELIERLSEEERFFLLFRMYGAEQKESELRKTVFEFRKMVEQAGIDPKSLLQIPLSSKEDSIFNGLQEALQSYILQIQSLKSTSALQERLERATVLKENLDRCHRSISWAQLSVCQENVKGLSHQSLTEPCEKIKLLFERFYAASVADLTQGQAKTFLEFFIQFHELFENFKAEHHVLDFSDLLIKTKNMLSRNDLLGKTIRKRYQNYFEYVHVDEYQDTNRVQDEIVSLLTRSNNLFMVGDAKQSIYAFQGARVEIFQTREANFQNHDQSMRIVLNENFRSHASILEWVNSFFNPLWQDEKMPYEPLKACRAPIKEFPEAVKTLFTVRQDEESLEKARIREARTLAAYLKNLADQQHTSFRDMTILFHALSNVNLYENELRQAGLPYYVVKGRGFYERQEIRDLVDMMSLVNHPLNDFTLAAVLRSPLVGISEDTLYWLSRLAKELKRGEALYVGLTRLTYQDKIKGEQLDKLMDFQKLRNLLEKERHLLSISQILRRVLDTTHYEAKLLGHSDGPRRYANVQKLLEMARQFERQEDFGLDDFIRYIENCSINEAKESEAALELEQGDVIRLMTIHQAKGLEFPVTVVADLGSGKRFTSSPFFIFTPEIGLGWRVRHPLEEEWVETATFKQWKEQRKKEAESEQKRLMYVAMTRAEQHLVLSGVLSADWQERENEKLSTWADRIAKVKGISDPGVPERVVEIEKDNLQNPIENTLREKKPFDLLRIEERKDVWQDLEVQTQKVLEQIELPQTGRSWLRSIPVSAFMRYEKCPLSYFYRYGMGFQDDATLYEEEQKETLRLEDGVSLSAADFGTLFHRVMEFFDFKADFKEESKRSVEAVSRGLSKVVKDRLAQSLENLVNNPLIQEIRRARRVFREIDFLHKFKTATVRGQIDMLFEDEHSQWILVDYKTSRVSTESLEKTAASYRSQMELYALACQKISGLHIAKAYLMFTELGMNLEILMDETILEERRKWVDLALEGMSGKKWIAQVSDFCDVCSFRSFCPKQTLTV